MSRDTDIDALHHLAAIDGYTTVFWWCAGIFAAGALICGTLLRRGGLPLHEGAPAAEPSRQAETVQAGEPIGQAQTAHGSSSRSPH